MKTYSERRYSRGGVASRNRRMQTTTLHTSPAIDEKNNKKTTGE